MARPICIWLPSLTLCALSACGGSETGFFNDLSPGGGGSSHAGASSHAGSSSNSGSANGGGSANSAGNPGSAGTLGSAGNPGSAGQAEAGSDSGGAQTGGASSGGRGGAHSNGGSGGSRAGAGGSGAAAGHAGAPVGVAGVGGADQDLSCAELTKQANQQLDAARACNVAMNSLQCTSTVSNPCGCEVPVQKAGSAETKAYLETLKQLKDKDCSLVCPKIACSVVTDAQCQASGSSTMGTCVVSHGPQP